MEAIWSWLAPLGIGALILAIVLWGIKLYMAERIKRLAGRSRSARFTRRQIERYQKSITDDFQAHRAGFTIDAVIDINQVYVPLQSQQGGERKDLYEGIRQEPRSVVIGPAGAGKSLLLKNSMLMWAREPTRRVPVLVELHRCNSSTEELIDLVAAEIGRCLPDRRRRPDRDRTLAEQALATGRLSLLFDGLDEVGRDDHDRVVRALLDFARRYRDCQIVVTCRDVVYQGQLSTQFRNLVRVAEFDDAGILRFLGNWPGIGGTPVVAELFGTLQKNPALMRLARSPLLLTMIAYLHVEVFSKTGRTLPTSRPAFYDRAISHLLGRDADLDRSGSVTVFDVGEKRAVLQRAALAMQESTGGDAADRRTITDVRLRQLTQEMLPDLNLDREQIKPLLGEIVDRSQLLFPLDKRRSQYQFRHTTLQEYLAAVELTDDPERLLTCYRADPLAWRETVKLWCGSSSRDCTKVVKDIFVQPEQHHKILALECLSEARRIDSDFADRIIEYFRRQLRHPGSGRSAIAAAFGAVAADSRPRGRQVLDLLKSVAAHAGSPASTLAMQALSASGRQEAARVLAGLVSTQDDARTALRGMGELALPVLTANARNGQRWAIGELGAIGTPTAAVALSSLLWTQDVEIAVQAAWHLADLLRSPHVETILRERGHIGEAPVLDWIWQPFAQDKAERLSVVTGRIAFLLEASSFTEIPSTVQGLDPRIGIPLIVMHGAHRQPMVTVTSEQWKRVDNLAYRLTLEHRRWAFLSQTEHVVDAIEMASAQPAPTDVMLSLRREIAKVIQLDPKLNRMLTMLGWRVDIRIVGVLIKQWHGTRVKRRYRVQPSDWLTVLTPVGNSKPLWTTFRRTAIMSVIALTMVAGTRAVLTITGTLPFGPEWLSYSLLGAVVLVAVAIAVDEYGGLSDFEEAVTMIGFAVGVVASPVALVFAATTLVLWLPLAALVGLLALVMALAVLWLIARRWDRINDNVFRRCWEAQISQASGQTSVIAT